MATAKTLSDFEKASIEQSVLCDDLERIADALPDDVDRGLALRVAEKISIVLDRAHDLEENEVFPILEARAHESALVQTALNRFRNEHQQDACFAEEVREALIEFATGTRAMAPDALGYMLRGFFVSLRRHISVEREMVDLVLA
ncbi:MAG: hemerythrin domain-containing protein [Hyphomicrobiaceae bacterium]|nr:hemerythrin domain-containing protein [Hyphomicrobiaceae bacterium]